MTEPLRFDDILTFLHELHAKVRVALGSHGYGRSGGSTGSKVNPKGDVQEPFDLVADEIVRQSLCRQFPAGIVLSEEHSDVVFGVGIPPYRFVVDPIDGSDNWKRGLPLSAVCVAGLHSDADLAINEVLFAVVGDLSQETPCVAVRGQGAFRGGQRLRTSRVGQLTEATVSVELNGFCPTAQFARFMEAAAGIRSYCCTALALVMIAEGILDAHVDIRRRVTPESYLASSLILREAGGVLLDIDDESFPSFGNLVDRRSIIAAGTRELAQEIGDMIAGAASHR